MSPLDSLPARKHQALHPPQDIWSEIARTKALAEAAEDEEARRQEAARREALKGSLESQVAERRRQRQEELKARTTEAREIIALTVRKEKEELRSQAAAAEARRKADEEQAAFNERMRAAKLSEEAKRAAEERRAVEDLESSIRHDAERTQAKRSEYVVALRRFLADNGKYTEAKAAAAQRAKEDEVRLLRSAIEAQEAHERRRQAELDARLASLQKRLDRPVVYVPTKVASDRELEEKADRELREFLRRQDEAARRVDSERRRGLEEQIVELERQVAEKKRATEATRVAGHVERDRTQREVREAEEREKREAAQRAAAVVAHKSDLEAQIIEARRAMQVPDESEVERRLNATLLETYRAKATERGGGGGLASPTKGSTSRFF